MYSTYGHNVRYGHEGKRPRGRSKHSWEDNIGLDLKETGREGVDLMHVDQDRVRRYRM